MDRLAEIFGKENVLKDEPMSRHTTFRIGGAADFFVKVQTISQLQEAMRYLKKEQIPFYIVGNGSNLFALSCNAFINTVIFCKRMRSARFFIAFDKHLIA